MMKPPKRKRVVEINLRDTQDIDDLIWELRDVKRRVKRNGGEYHIRRDNESGIVIFNISVPHMECK